MRLSFRPFFACLGAHQRGARAHASVLSLAVGALLLLCAAAHAEDKNGVSPARLKLPKGPGSLEGVGENVEPNLSMGLMTYGIPIQLPHGYDGASPSLRLSYSSGGGSGEVGLGWSLGLPSIERMTSRGLPTYTPADRFAANGSEELVPLGPPAAAGTVYRARYEGGFVRYTYLVGTSLRGSFGYWKAEYPDGRVGYFGATAAGTRRDDARVEGRSGTFRYLLADMVDPLDHHVLYEYQKDGAASLPSHISWVFDAQNTARYRVDFSYEPRPDELSDCRPGIDVRMTKRMSGIRVLVNGQQLRRYALSYAPSSATTGLSLLAQVQQFGRFDADGPYPIDFHLAYSDSLARACRGSACGTPPMVRIGGTLTQGTSGPASFKNGTAELLDVNGDGLPDVVDTDTTQDSHHRFYLNTLLVADAGTTQTWTAAQRSQVASSDFALNVPGVQPFDVDGDGFTDMAKFDGTGVSWLRNGRAGDWQAAAPTLSRPSSLGFPDPELRFFDFNGDRRMDLIRSDGMFTQVFENTGVGFGEVTDGGIENVGLAFSQGLQLADMNGDGLLDAVQVLSDATVTYRLNLGQGRWGASRTMFGLPSTATASDVRLADLNGDSLSDAVLVLPGAIHVYLNQSGTSFPSRLEFSTPSAPVPGDPDVAVRLADMNGNGTTDVAWFSAAGIAMYVDLTAERPNLLTHIQTGIGKTIDVAYSSTAWHQALDAASGTTWTWQLPQPNLTVDRITTWEPLNPGAAHMQEFHYRDGYYDSEEKQFRGFVQVEVTETAGPGVEPGFSRYTFDVGAPSAIGGVGDSYRKALLLTQATQSSGRLLSTTINEYQDCPVAGLPAGLAPAVRSVCQTSTEVIHSEGLPAGSSGTDGPDWVRTREEYTSDGYGNRTLVVKRGIISRGGGACGPCAYGADVFGQVCGADCHGDESFEATDFVPPSATGGRWMLRRPWRQRTSGTDTTAVPKETVTFYDSLTVPGRLTVGLPTLTQARKDPVSNPIDVQRLAYGPNGEVLSTEDANHHRRQFGYDDAGLLLTSETVLFADSGHAPYRLVMGATYAPVLEQVETATQWMRFEGTAGTATASLPRTTTYRFDGFGRLTAIFKPGDWPSTSGGAEYPTEEYRYDLKPGLSRIIRSIRTTHGGPLDLEETQCLDGKGRKLQSLTRLGPQLYQADGWKVMSGLDKEVSSAQPFQMTSNDCGSPPASVGVVSLSLDALGRGLTVTQPDAADHHGIASVSRTEYLPSRERYFDEEDTDVAGEHSHTPSTIWMDGLGRKSRIERYLTSKTQPVGLDFTYDEFGHLTGYVDSAGNRKNQAWDLLDRIVAVDDPDSHHTSFVYDDAGNETERSDARGVTHKKSYDEANRLRAEWDAAQPVTSRLTYVYDEAPPNCSDCRYVEGQLAHVTYGLDAADLPGLTGSDWFGYSVRGLPVFQRRRLEDVGHTKEAARVFDFRTDYDNADRMVGRHFPGNVGFATQLDGAGRVQAVPGYVELVRWNERGLLDGMDLPPHVTTSRTYDARLRLRTQIASRGSGAQALTLQDELVDYDRVGNVVGTHLHGPEGALAVADSVYGYDEGYRLTSASIARPDDAQEILAYTYDDIDNLTSKRSSREERSAEHVGAYTYGENAGPHAVTTAGALHLSYDAAGFMKTRGDLGLAWDFRGNLATATRGSQTVARYSTGPGFRRITKKEAGHVTHFLAPDFEVRDGVGVAFVQVGGERVARLEVPTTAADYFPDLAPASLGGPALLTPEADGIVTGGDAWLAQAVLEGMYSTATPDAVTTGDVDGLLAASCRRQLDDILGLDREWWLNDYRGTLIATLDMRGTTSWAEGRMPYGVAWSRERGTPQEYTFEGKEEDETGFQYFGARYFDPRLGQWITPDPNFDNIQEISPLLGAQPFARYSFALSNPLSTRDRDGHFANWAIGAAVGGTFSAAVYALEQTYQGKSIEPATLLAEFGTGAIVGGLTSGVGSAGTIGKAGQLAWALLKDNAGKWALSKVVKQVGKAVGGETGEAVAGLALATKDGIKAANKALTSETAEEGLKYAVAGIISLVKKSVNIGRGLAAPKNEQEPKDATWPTDGPNHARHPQQQQQQVKSCL